MVCGHLPVDLGQFILVHFATTAVLDHKPHLLAICKTAAAVRHDQSTTYILIQVSATSSKLSHLTLARIILAIHVATLAIAANLVIVRISFLVKDMLCFMKQHDQYDVNTCKM